MRARSTVLSLLLLLGGMLGLPVVTAADAKPAPKPAVKAANRIDLNSASEKELIDLPGVGEVNAKKIVAHRPYSSLKDLSRAGLTDATIKKLSPHAKVGRSTAASKQKPAATVPAQHTQRAPRDKPAASAPSHSTAQPKAAPSQRDTNDRARAALPEDAAAAASAGKVWLNTDSNIYHRSDSHWYGHTKQGKFVDESEAINAGARESKEGQDKSKE